MTHVCITGNEQNPIALERRLERVLGSNPRVLCELRLDFLDFHPPNAFGFLARLPAEWAPRLILTQRLKASGAVAKGNCSWDVQTWQSWWKDVIALRPWFAVDLDWVVLDRLAGESLAWRGSFRSRHAFFSLHANLDEAEELLPSLVASAREHNAGVKLACPVKGMDDLNRLAKISRELEDQRIVVAMGPAGRAWRWSRLAGRVSYFAAESALSTAPGQDTFADVLPYLSQRNRPELYLLLGDNPNNNYGESRWNRVFLRRGAAARYINLPCVDAPGLEFGRSACDWMDAAGIAGASVTKPFKQSFPEPTNTLKRKEHSWQRSNTDALAVVALLERHGVLPGQTVIIAGGGGAARAVEHGLRERGYCVELWVRAEGQLGNMPRGVALVSTWPGEYQESLLASLRSDSLRVVIDAQFTRPKEEAPLSLWCAVHGIAYEPGSEWWRIQARKQDEIWFGSERLQRAFEQIYAAVPDSKSETIRALAIGLSFGVPVEIMSPSVCQDTEVFAQAMESLGASIDRTRERWKVFPPGELVAPEKPIFMSEGATGFRILGAMSALMNTRALQLSGDPVLLSRPHEELYRVLCAKAEGGVISIPPGGLLPERISLERSSQFASAFLLVGAAKVFRRELAEYCLEIVGERRSESYLELTIQMLESSGLRVHRDGNYLRVTQEKKLQLLRFQIAKDASSLAFLEVLARRWNLDSFYGNVDLGRQGDAVFPRLLDQLIAGDSKLSLRHHPDLAPPLWAAAALFRKELQISECPQLRLKESDRAELLVLATKNLGGEAALIDGGFRADLRNLSLPQEEMYLRTDGDHRLAMAYGILGTELKVAPDRRDCVQKSFPAFWQVLKIFDEAMPG